MPMHLRQHRAMRGPGLRAGLLGRPVAHRLPRCAGGSVQRARDGRRGAYRDERIRGVVHAGTDGRRAQVHHGSKLRGHVHRQDQAVHRGGVPAPWHQTHRDAADVRALLAEAHAAAVLRLSVPRHTRIVHWGDPAVRGAVRHRRRVPQGRVPHHAAARPSALHAIPVGGVPAQPLHSADALHVALPVAVQRTAFFPNASGNVIRPLKRLVERPRSVLGGDAHDILGRIDWLHQRLKADYTVRRELDCYLLALYYDARSPKEWMVLDINDTFHYYNLPDLMHVVRGTLMGLCCSPWLQRLFNIFLCGKRYRRLVTTADTSCQLTAAIINTLHGLLLGLYPFNERRMDFGRRVQIAGALHSVLTGPTSHGAFIAAHPNLLCLSLAEYILNVVHDFCPVEWALLGITSGAKSQCLAILESFREASVNVGTELCWDRLEADAQVAIGSMTKFFRDTSLYQHRPRGVLPAAMVQYLPLALRTRTIQNASSIFGQLRCALPEIGFKESEALEEIWGSVYTRQLPTHTTTRQMDTLTRMGRMCHLVEHELHHLPMCLACTLTRRADTLKALFRYDTVGCMLVCNECLDHRNVVRINMLGKILYVREKAIVLCEGCLRPKYWDAHCQCTVEEQAATSACCVCGNTNTVSCKDIVDVQRFEIRVVHFCYKHSLACVVNSATVYDMRTLEEEMRNRTFSRPTARKE